MWVAIGLAVGLVAAGILVVVLAVVGRRRGPASEPRSEVTADTWISLGVIFAGTGAALMATLGPFMVWMVVLGIIYLGMGARMKRGEPR
jgi:hypothetical protein